MKDIDLIAQYGNRNIEGIDRNDLLAALNNQSKIFKVKDEKIVVCIPVNKEIFLDCIIKYFVPEKSYYKLNDTDSCHFKQKAFNIVDVLPCQCSKCFQQCLESNMNIKQNKFLISKNFLIK